MLYDLDEVPTLVTDRLRLRLPDLDDLPAFTAMTADPSVMAFLNGGEPLSDDESWQRLAAMLGHWAMLGYGFSPSRRSRRPP